MYLRIIKHDDGDNVFNVWAGLEQGSLRVLLWSDKDFIEQPYSFIVGQGATPALALVDAEKEWQRAVTHVIR